MSTCTCSDTKAAAPLDLYADKPVVTLDYQIAVMQAAREGKTIQGNWRRQDPFKDMRWVELTPPRPTWDWDTYIYRVSPSCRPKKLMAWTAETIPVHAPLWIRAKGGDACRLVTAFTSESVYEGYGTAKSYAKLFTNFEFTHSPWQNNSWLPCGAEVPS